MKKAKLLFLLSNFLILNLGYAQVYNGPTQLSNTNTDNIIIHGSANLKQLNTKTLVVYGPVQFNNLNVKNEAKIFGSVNNSENGNFGILQIKGLLKGSQISCNSLTVYGFVDGDELHVTGNTQIFGAIKANHSKFQDLNIASDKSMLSNTRVNNIIMNLDNERIDNTQTLYLNGNTKVNGNINFSTGKGTVITQGANVVIKGKINGGTLKKENLQTSSIDINNEKK